MHDLFYVRLMVEIEKARRIRVAVWAYAYELKDNPLVSDEKYDEEAQKIDPSVDTENAVMDAFFRSELFHPDTGMWIRSHPELDKIERLYHEHYTDKK